MMKHPENFLTVKYQRASAAQVAMEFNELASLTGSGLDEDRTLDSHLRLLDIEKHLTSGHELFGKGKFQQAIEEYKLVQGFALRLLSPAFPVGLSQRPELKIPVEANMLEPMLTASLGFIEAMEPRTIESDFSAIFDVPEEVLKLVTVFSGIGVDVTSDLPRTVVSDSALALGYAERGQWVQAEFFLERAQRNLDGSHLPVDNGASAALNLSLGAVLVQRGRVEDAKTALKRSAKGFERLKDTVGQAQVNLNLAAAFAKDGDHDTAASLLAKAEQLITAAQGLPEIKRIEEQPPTADTPSRGEVRLNTPIKTTDLAMGRTKRFLPLLKPVLAVRATSLKPGALSEAVKERGLTVTFRLAEKGGGWTTQTVETKVESAQKDATKELGVWVGDEVTKIQWKSNQTIDSREVIDKVYKKRVDFDRIKDLSGRWDLPSDLAVNLPHIYFYVIPISLGDCYQALGDYSAAQESYLKAADYEFINTHLELPGLWQRLARNALEWGDRFYKADEVADALAIYRTVLEPPGGGSVVFSDSPLYKHPKLKLVGDTVENMLATLDAAGLDTINPTLAAIVLEIRARMLQLKAGLDFLGMPATSVPVWSFDFLQNVARYFAQQAIHAEREFINWLDRAENEELTRQQLQQTVTQADAERELARQQREAAESEAAAYAAGVDLSQLRADNATANRDDYSALSWDRIWLQRTMAWYSSQNPWERNNPIPGNGPDAGKEIHQVMAEKTERLQTITRDYELGSMQRQIEELQAARDVAVSQQAAAMARVEAAAQMEVVAGLRRAAAADTLEAFDNQFFTPEVWYQMGQFMRSISGHYLTMAIMVARQMQRAYNFENDLERKFIKVDYSTNTVRGLLGADALLLNIDSFTYDLITAVSRKRMPVKQTISLAERYPFLFETALRQTGVMEFDTRVEDFDLAFPGTFQRRLERVEVEIDGVLPSAGVRGVLTNDGISRDRTLNINQIKFRIQPRENLVLSEHRIRDDAFVFPIDASRLSIFKGAGVAGTWTLELPRLSNDIDYRAISDVRLVFYYQASYDQGLATAVKGQLAALAGVNLHAKTLPLRWTYPDAFFNFQDTGQLFFSVTPVDFPYNELDPQLKHVAIVVVPDPGVDPSQWTIRLGTPGHTATIAAQPSVDGSITADVGHLWQPLAGGSATGEYLVEVRLEENPNLEVGGLLDLTPIQNIVVVFEYSFTPRV